MANVPEFMLHQRLNAIRGNPEQRASLKAFDEHGLLPQDAIPAVAESSAEYQVNVIPAPVPKEIESLDDIFSDDALGILDDAADSIFTIKNVPKEMEMPSKIAKRKRCKNFDKFEALFKTCHADLKSREREQHKFTGEQQIQRGMYFILHGVMCYVADMEERVKKNGKVNAKLHLIFENGTESNMLLRSLATELYKDETGRRVLPKAEDALDSMLGIKEERSSIRVYLHSSVIKFEPRYKLQLKTCIKLDNATTSVEKRIANARKRTNIT